MILDNIYKEIESIEDDKEKILYLARVINYIEELGCAIGFKESEVNFIKSINIYLKQEIDKVLNHLTENFMKEIEFILYYNNTIKIQKEDEKKLDNRINRTFKFR